MSAQVPAHRPVIELTPQKHKASVHTPAERLEGCLVSATFYPQCRLHTAAFRVASRLCRQGTFF
eukprot:6214497-Pleurochrysis_carterae.AAC.1